MDISLKHTSLSCTHYKPGDDLGKLLAYVALAPILTIVYQFSKVYTRRDIHEGALLAGLVLEEAMARVLKQVMKHPRPATCKMLNICHSHGMPSSHTSMMFSYFTITTCLAFQLYSRRSSVSQLLSGIEQLLCGSIAVAVGWSRVYLGYHSIDQVLAGAAVGTAFGLLWAGVMHLLQPLYRQLSHLHVLRVLGVKDTYSCAEPLIVEQKAYDSLMASQKGKTK
eukprot:GHUV01015497.1.p1 GENE.GHUV01015497.1~~GHUV01015497.1.p1  ORF type:complete len:223 (+),score=43.79 GHUV01015497.1:259-927(+)